MPLANWDGAGQDALQCAVVADNRHLGAFHPKGDALSGQVEADVDLRAGQTDEAGRVDHALDLDGGACAGREEGRPGRAGAGGGQADQLGDTKP
jgi:hypothetical protein